MSGVCADVWLNHDNSPTLKIAQVWRYPKTDAKRHLTWRWRQFFIRRHQIDSMKHSNNSPFFVDLGLHSQTLPFPSTNDFYQLAVLKLRRSQKCRVGFIGPDVGFTSPKCILGAGCKLLTWPDFLFGETLCEFLNNEEGWKVAKQIFSAYFIQTTNDTCMNSVTILIYLKLYMGVSKNRGNPKWMVYNGNPY